MTPGQHYNKPKKRTSHKPRKPGTKRNAMRRLRKR